MLCKILKLLIKLSAVGSAHLTPLSFTSSVNGLKSLPAAVFGRHCYKIHRSSGTFHPEIFLIRGKKVMLDRWRNLLVSSRFDYQSKTQHRCAIANQYFLKLSLSLPRQIGHDQLLLNSPRAGR